MEIVRQRPLRTGDLEFSATAASDVDQYLCVVDEHMSKSQFAELFIAYTPPGESANPVPGATLKELGDGTLICDKITCNQQPRQSLLWYVAVYWKSLDDTPQQLSFPTPNSGTLDPDGWLPSWSRRPVTVFEEMQKAFYKGGYSGKAHAALTGGGRKQVVSSALVPFERTPDHRRRYEVWNFKWLRTAVPSALVAAEGKINNDSFTFTLGGLEQTWEEKTALIDGVNLTPVKWGNTVLVEIACEVIHDIEGFEMKILDQGTMRRQMIGDYDDLGVIITTVSPSSPLVKQITDKFGNAIQYPVKFNGNGQPLSDSQLAFGDTYYGTWSDFEEVAFSSVPLLNSL